VPLKKFRARSLRSSLRRATFGSALSASGPSTTLVVSEVKPLRTGAVSFLISDLWLPIFVSPRSTPSLTPHPARLFSSKSSGILNSERSSERLKTFAIGSGLACEILSVGMGGAIDDIPLDGMVVVKIKPMRVTDEMNLFAIDLNFMDA